MANILDIRRRIRSVINTRQITRAMKMISAARLRRAQERALAARPYAQMLTNVLKSLVSRADIYDSATGEILHPLLVKRDEKNVLLIAVTGDKGLAGAFNANILKAASKFIDSQSGKNIELEAIGRKGRDFLRRRFAAAEPRKADSPTPSQTTLVGEQVGVLNKVEYSLAAELADRLIERYARAEIDSVYIVYNEFKSVIAQRLVVEQFCPSRNRAPLKSEAMGEKEKQQSRSRKGRGVSDPPRWRSEADAAHFAESRWITMNSHRNCFAPRCRAMLPYRFAALLESVAAEHAAVRTAIKRQPATPAR
jgi:F-type H+-transporting ATPase subunit gamma